MAPEPVPGRTMVPLVPALVMLGLVAGAHGDSKSDPSSCGISQVKRLLFLLVGLWDGE